MLVQNQPLPVFFLKHNRPPEIFISRLPDFMVASSFTVAVAQ
jgi:hypothetical protein